MKTNDKYIDLSQFVHNKNGTISWKNSVGIIATFFINNISHQIEILDYINAANIKIMLDNNYVKTVQSGEIVNLSFEKLFYQPTYKYDVGDVIDDIEILKKIKIERSKSNKYLQKAYECYCKKDEYTFVISECDLNRGRRCPLCANKIVIKGVNDIATTNPEMVQYLKNKEDAYKYTAQSNQVIDIQCPICGFVKKTSICNFYNNGFSCDMCSDGISYSNKFAHELFRQLYTQYLEYEYEYSPYWAKKYRYDNYIKLCDGKEVIFEMDGAFHYIENLPNNDNEKDLLAFYHNIHVVHIDCNYTTMTDRFRYIKNNTINALKYYFDLDYVDWDKCNISGISSIIIEVAKYYNDNSQKEKKIIAKHFNISTNTLRNYLKIGNELGLCNYIKNEHKQSWRSTIKPIAVYDSNNMLMGVYKSAEQLEKELVNLKLYKSSVFRAAKNNKMYKGYFFKFITKDEYLSFVN